MYLSVLIPVYNSRKLLLNTVEILIKSLRNMSLDYEILLRDDGSRDGSKKVMEELSQRHPTVRSFYNNHNRGLGFTLRQLFQDAEGEVFVYMDCDLPFGVENLSILFKEIDHYDIVVMSRYMLKLNRVRFLRRLTSFLYFLLCRILFSIAVRDVGSGTVAIRKNVAQSLTLQADGFEIHAEIFTKAHKKGFKIKEVPAEFQDRGMGHFSILKHGPLTVLSTLKLWEEAKR